MKSRSRLKSPTDNPQIQAPLFLLKEAWDSAVGRGRDIWEFAVPLRSFLSAGITETNLRWLADGRYIEHRLERTRPKDAHRIFQQVRNLNFSEKSCFVMTKKGRDVARQNGGSRSVRLKDAKSSNTGRRKAKANRPFWDQASHTLYWQGKPLKHYKAEAPYQEAVLRTLQRQQWRQCVTVSFPKDSKVNPKDRLHNTIKNLNRELSPFLRFHLEGGGTRVSWEAIYTKIRATPMQPKRNP